eukprot:7575567-Alexandrium_andersonii.AAC.1
MDEAVFEAVCNIAKCNIRSTIFYIKNQTLQPPHGPEQCRQQQKTPMEHKPKSPVIQRGASMLRARRAQGTRSGPAHN